MNVLKKSYLMGLLLTLTFSAFSFSGPDSQSRAVKKAIEAVEEAESYDWKTLAQSAEVCFKKKENIEQALEWINRSIELNEDPYNLEIKGDYYRSEGQNREAMKYYYQAISVGKAQNFGKDNSRLQQKIWELR